MNRRELAKDYMDKWDERTDAQRLVELLDLLSIAEEDGADAALSIYQCDACAERWENPGVVEQLVYEMQTCANLRTVRAGERKVTSRQEVYDMVLSFLKTGELPTEWSPY